MKNPCIDCVAPKRYPGCHDSCQEKNEYDKIVLGPKREYLKKYCKGNWAYDSFNPLVSTQMAREKARKNKKVKSHGH